MYTIEADYTGTFMLQYPFKFAEYNEAQQVCISLNMLRMTLNQWKDLKPFKVIDEYTGKVYEININDSK